MIQGNRFIYMEFVYFDIQIIEQKRKVQKELFQKTLAKIFQNHEIIAHMLSIPQQSLKHGRCGISRTVKHSIILVVIIIMNMRSRMMVTYLLLCITHKKCLLTI